MIESTALAASNSSLVDRFRERLGDAHDGVRMTALEGTGAIMQSAIQQGPPFWIFGECAAKLGRILHQTNPFNAFAQASVNFTSSQGTHGFRSFS